MKKDNMLIISTVIAVLFYMYSLTMDATVSYTVYKYNPYFFINHEVNRYFIRLLSGDGSSHTLIVFANTLYILLPSISILIYTLIDDGYKTAKKYCELLILIIDVIVFIVGILHILSAYSWIMI